MAKSSKSTSKTEIAHSERAHSDVVGGSSASTRLNCPRSYREEMKVPEHIRNKSSSYADEGTALHEAMEYILQNDVDDLKSMLGMEFNGYVLDRTLINEGVAPALDAFDDICDEYESEGGLQFIQEKKCQLPGIDNAFGTSDIIARTDKRTIILDWKFGAGVAVKAAYPPHEVGGPLRVNEQLMFYGRAAAHTHPEMFETDENGKVPDDWPVELIIVQPRVRQGETLSRVTVPYRKLEEFRIALVKAVQSALHDIEPEVREGPWCKFRACQSNCPLKLQPLADLSKLTALGAKRKPGDKPIDWATRYAHLLDLAARAEETIKAIQGQAHAYLDEGNMILNEDGTPAYKLVPKRASEIVVDSEGLVKHVLNLGLTKDKIYSEPVLRSAAQLRGELEPLMEGDTKKARTEVAKAEIGKFTDMVSSGTTLAPADDSRLDVTPTPAALVELVKKLGIKNA
jgi:hypothetical protein